MAMASNLPKVSNNDDDDDDANTVTTPTTTTKTMTTWVKTMSPTTGCRGQHDMDAQMYRTGSQPSVIRARELIAGYEQWAVRLIGDGFEPYLLTLMFKQLDGGPAHLHREMTRATEELYVALLTRTCRDPNLPRNRDRLPVWFVAPDFAVNRRSKDHLQNISINDGRHNHAIAFVPPNSQLRMPLDDFFLLEGQRYYGPSSIIDRVHVEAITHDPEYVVRYGLKAVARNWASNDDLLVLPREKTELPVRTREERLADYEQFLIRSAGEE
jgi:hypothetical protein